MRWSCARVGVEVSKAAGMMPEHSPVPPEACRGPRVDDQRRTVPMSGKGARRPFGFVPIWLFPFLATPQRSHRAPPARAAQRRCENRSTTPRMSRSYQIKAALASIRATQPPRYQPVCPSRNPQPRHHQPAAFHVSARQRAHPAGTHTWLPALTAPGRPRLPATAPAAPARCTLVAAAGPRHTSHRMHAPTNAPPRSGYDERQDAPSRLTPRPP